MEEKAACVQPEGLQSIIDMQLNARKEDREHESRMTEMMLKTLEKITAPLLDMVPPGPMYYPMPQMPHSPMSQMSHSTMSQMSHSPMSHSPVPQLTQTTYSWYDDDSTHQDDSEDKEQEQ
jgi:hypothetical protein